MALIYIVGILFLMVLSAYAGIFTVVKNFEIGQFKDKTEEEISADAKRMCDQLGQNRHNK